MATNLCTRKFFLIVENGLQTNLDVTAYHQRINKFSSGAAAHVCFCYLALGLEIR